MYLISDTYQLTEYLRLCHGVVVLLAVDLLGLDTGRYPGPGEMAGHDNRGFFVPDNKIV